MTYCQAPCTSSPQEGQNPKFKVWFLQNAISFLHICKAGKSWSWSVISSGPSVLLLRTWSLRAFLAEAADTFEGLYKLIRTLRGQSSAARKRSLSKQKYTDVSTQNYSSWVRVPWKKNQSLQKPIGSEMVTGAGTSVSNTWEKSTTLHGKMKENP